MYNMGMTGQSGTYLESILGEENLGLLWLKIAIIFARLVE